MTIKSSLLKVSPLPGLLLLMFFCSAAVNAETPMDAANEDFSLQNQAQKLLVMQYGGKMAARERVKKWPCAVGGTLEQCLQRKAVMPGFKDGGWQTSLLPGSGYQVDRVFLMNGNLPLRYSWIVDDYGHVTPQSMRAELITEMQ